MKHKTIKDLFAKLEDQANESINFGNSKEKHYGYGIKYCLEKIEDFCREHKIILKK